MEHIIALIALTLMEIVLGIDNIVFIAVLTGRLPANEQPRARQLGLFLALGTRLLLLLTLSYMMGLTGAAWHFNFLEDPLTKMGVAEETRKHIVEITWKDLILVVGGMFLLWKSVREIHNHAEGKEESPDAPRQISFSSVLVQVTFMDIIFSLDSVITAVGMAKQIWVMVAAMIIAVGVMLVFSETVSRFVQNHPTLKMLALSFLILIGVMLVAEGIGTHIEKGYIYFAMAFALGVEFLNIRTTRRGHTVLPT